jgi:excisionase family DNA binding protein
MRKVSKKRQALLRKVKPIRDGLRNEVGHCEVCLKHSPVLDVHEIGRGNKREACLGERCALLVVCRWCHDDLGSAGEWPEARQLALLANRRLFDWDLDFYLEITSPRAPERITVDQVVKHMIKRILKVDEVADRMRVNRRTVQSWIDSGKLPAIDLRPSGAQRAIWRVEVEDLLKFVQERSTKRKVK